MASTGWTTFIYARPRPSISLSRHLDTLTPLGRARYIHLVDRAWSSQTPVARPLLLGHYAIQDASPCLVVTPTMLVIAVANALYVYDFLRGGLEVRWRGQVQLHRGGAHEDISGIGHLGGQTLLVSCTNGQLLRLVISPPGETLRVTTTAHYAHPPTHTNNITSLSTSRVGCGLALTTRSAGVVSLYCTRSPWVEPTSWAENATTTRGHPRIWCSLIARSDTLALTGSTRITLRPILPTGAATSTWLPGPLKPSACYALAQLGEDTILSGWHDGIVRMYDLRARTTDAVMSLGDPWSDSGVYSVGTGGGSGTHIVAGYSKHGMASLARLIN